MNTQAAASQPQSLTDITFVVAGAIALVALVAGGSILRQVESPKQQDPQCASLARAMVNHTHSMLEGKAARGAIELAYHACQVDPTAFRNQLR